MVFALILGMRYDLSKKAPRTTRSRKSLRALLRAKGSKGKGAVFAVHPSFIDAKRFGGNDSYYASPQKGEEKIKGLSMELRLYYLIAGLLALSACSRQPEPEELGPGAVAERAISDAAMSAGVSENNILNCTVPVSKDLSAKALTDIYRGQARINVIRGLEGEVSRAVVLYPKMPTRRVEVLFWDTAMTQVSDASLAPTATDWVGPGGVRLGATLREVETMNGKPFVLMGFGWEAGGTVVDFRGGKLSRLDGCGLKLRFGVADKGGLPEAVRGDHPLRSDDPAFGAAAPVVSELRLTWPQETE